MPTPRIPAAMLTVAVALGGTVAAMATGGSAFATDWSGFGLDAGRTRATAEVLGLRFAPAWRAEIPHPSADVVYRKLLASPAVADGFVAVATYGNILRVLRESDGVTLWEARVGDAVIASPIIDRGWLYVACLDRNLYAFRLNDGRPMWKTDLGGITYSSPLIESGSIVVAAGAPAPRLLRLDAETGRIIWSAGATLLRQSIDSSVAMGAGHVIVGETHGRFHAFAFSDGRHEWTADVGGTVGLASPLVLGNRAYLPTGGVAARLSAVDLATGTPQTGESVDLTSSVVPATTTGKLLGRRIVLSSLAAADGLILVDARADDRIDTDNNGAVDLFRSREAVIAVDPAAGRVAWTHPNGARDTTDANQIPTHGLLPTPGVHRAATGETAVVVTSTLEARVAVLDPRSDLERSSLALPSATLASPVSANGRLILATDAGTIVALGSLDNSAPASPVGLWPARGALADAASVVVTWPSVMDADGDAVTYQVRWDTDGEIWHNWLGESLTPAGVTTRQLPPIAAGAPVSYAVRARDARGAWSSWSAVETFTAVASPPVHIGSRAIVGLVAALGMARPGEIIQLGTGRYPLGATLGVPAGVTIQGAAPHLTVLDGQGLDTAVSFAASTADQPSALRSLTVRGARTGVAVGQGAHVLVQNTILGDNKAFGIDVGASGVATVISATLHRNDVAARSFGRLNIRNSIVARNRRGLVAMPREAITSRYNDLFANQEGAYDHLVAGMGDTGLEVLFRAEDAGDLRLVDQSPTTDHGDPTDDFSREPLPNGGRINMGAYAGTDLAELSRETGLAIDSVPGVPTPLGSTADPPSRGATPRGRAASAGCALGAVAPGEARCVGAAAPLLLGTLGLALALSARRRRRPR